MVTSAILSRPAALRGSAPRRTGTRFCPRRKGDSASSSRSSSRASRGDSSWVLLPAEEPPAEKSRSSSGDVDALLGAMKAVQNDQNFGHSPHYNRFRPCCGDGEAVASDSVGNLNQKSKLAVAKWLDLELRYQGNSNEVTNEFLQRLKPQSFAELTDGLKAVPLKNQT